MPIQQSTYAVPREDLGEAIRENGLVREDFIAADVLPVRGVKKKAATISVIMRENMKLADVDHANGAAFNRVNLNTEDLAYACTDKGLEGVLTDVDRENYDTDFDAELETSEDVEHKILIRQEVRVKDLVFNTTTFTGASLYTDNSGSPWDAIATKIIAQVQAAMEKVRLNTGHKADSMAIGEAAMCNLRKNTEIMEAFPGVAIVTDAMIRASLASLFGLKNLIVGRKVYDGAIEGQAFSGTDIWGDDYALVFKRNEGSVRSGGLGRIVLWTKMSPENVTVKQYREEQVEADIFRVRQFTDEKLFDAVFGHLMKIDA